MLTRCESRNALKEESAVNLQVDAGDERRVLRHEEGDRLSHVHLLAEPPQRVNLGPALVELENKDVDNRYHHNHEGDVGCGM